MSKVLQTLKKALAIGILTAAVWGTTPAAAGEGELTLGLGPGHASLPTQSTASQDGVSGSVYAEYQLTSFWGLSAGSTVSYHFSNAEESLPGQRINSLWVGGIYNLDVFTYVPFLSFGLAGYLADPLLVDSDGKDVNLGAKVGFGADWRRWRRWSVGVEINIHAFLTDVETYPVYITSVVRLNHHFDF